MGPLLGIIHALPYQPFASRLSESCPHLITHVWSWYVIESWSFWCICINFVSWC